MIKKIRYMTCLVCISMLQACGGGGGGDSMPGTRPSGKVEGVAHDAPLINAPVKVYAWDNGARGELLGSGATGSSGDYDLSITSPSRPVLVVAGNGGSYVEESSGVSVSLVDGQTMNAITNYESGKAISVQVTPFTHLASCYAEYLLGQGERVVDAINLSNSMVSSLVGVEIIRTKPIDVTNPSSANYDLTPGHKYGFLTAGISEAMAFISEENGLPAHSQRHLTSMHWASVACNDVRADGLLDGVGFYDEASTGVSDLAFGTYPITPDTYRTLVAQKMLTFTRNTRNASTLEVSDLLTFANALSTSTDPVWAGAAPRPVDDTGPAISAALAENSYISGTTDLAFTVEDPVGVAEVRFYVDNAFVDNGDITNPVFTLNTASYNDGSHIIAVESDDQIGNTSRAEYTYQIDNAGPSVVLTSPSLVGSASYTAVGTWTSPGADISTITVNGVAAEVVNDGTWSASITLASGTNLVTVVSVDSLANTSTQEFTVSADLLSPIISSGDISIYYTSYQGEWSTCDYASFSGPEASIPLCIRTDRVSLNGLAVNGNLPNLGYLSFEMRVEDTTSAGVYTEFEDLDVKYQYRVNGSVKKDWTSLDTGIRFTAPGTNYGWFYLPVTTEFLTDDWYQTSITDVHEFEVTVTDKVGHTTGITYKMSFDVVVPADVLSVTTESDAAGVFGKAFADRFSVDGQSVHVTTKIENTSYAPFYISYASHAEHAVLHEHESVIRKNRARINTTEEWRVDPYTDSIGMTNVSSLMLKDGSLIHPSATVGEYMDVSTDNVELPADTLWGSHPSYTCPSANLHQSLSNYYLPQYGHDYEYAACYSSKVFNKSINHFVFQTRTVHSSENETGYPRNDVASTSTDYSVISDDIEVWNATENQPAITNDGFYVVPANSVVEVRRVINLPIILHYNDVEVGDLGTFASYTTKYLDKHTDWTIDGRLTLEIAGSTGSTPLTMDAGLAKTTYSITRS